MQNKNKTENYTPSYQKIFYNYIRKNTEYFNSIDSDYFEDASIRSVYIIDKNHYDKYDKVADKSTLILEETKKAELRETIGLYGAEEIENRINTILLNLDEYDLDYVKTEFDNWLIGRKFYNTSFSILPIMRDNDLSVIEKYNKMVDIIEESQNSLYDEEDLGGDNLDSSMLMADEINEERMKIGYNFIDAACEGGLGRKELICFAGESGIGKSIWLANMAVNGIIQGYNVLYVTLEMSRKNVNKRINANLFNITMAEYSEILKDKRLLDRAISKVKKKIVLGSLVVKEYGTGTIAVQELDLFIKKYEKTYKHKLDILIVDYINIMKDDNKGNSENTYAKIKNIAEDLRGLGFKHSINVISATQINREGVKSGNITLGNIAESAGLAYTVDTFFGIEQNENDRSRGIFNLKVLKARNSGKLNHKAKFHIDYDKMKITEEAL